MLGPVSLETHLNEQADQIADKRRLAKSGEDILKDTSRLITSWHRKVGALPLISSPHEAKEEKELEAYLKRRSEIYHKNWSRDGLRRLKEAMGKVSPFRWTSTLKLFLERHESDRLQRGIMTGGPTESLCHKKCVCGCANFLGDWIRGCKRKEMVEIREKILCRVQQLVLGWEGLGQLLTKLCLEGELIWRGNPTDNTLDRISECMREPGMTSRDWNEAAGILGKILKTLVLGALEMRSVYQRIEFVATGNAQSFTFKLPTSAQKKVLERLEDKALVHIDQVFKSLGKHRSSLSLAKYDTNSQKVLVLSKMEDFFQRLNKPTFMKTVLLEKEKQKIVFKQTLLFGTKGSWEAKG